MKRFVRIFAIIAILLSCQKDDNETIPSGSNFNGLYFNSTSILGLVWDYEDTDAEGEIIVQDNHTFEITNDTRFMLLGGFKNPGNDTLVINGGELVLDSNEYGSFEYLTESQNYFYGNDFSYEVYASGVLNFRDTIYLPKRMYASVDTGIIRVGDTISWNADNLNSLGVIIYLEYDPEFSKDAGGKDLTSSSERVLNYAELSDNGIYSVTNSLLKDVPDSSFVRVAIARGNISIQDSKINSEVLKVLCHSTAYTILYKI